MFIKVPFDTLRITPCVPYIFSSVVETGIRFGSSEIQILKLPLSRGTAACPSKLGEQFAHIPITYMLTSSPVLTNLLLICYHFCCL